MSKKALVEYFPQFIMRVIFLIIVLTAILFLINSYIRTEVQTFDAEASLFIQRVLYSKNCLAYQDESTGQVYPGIVEYASLASDEFQERLAQCADYHDSRHLAASSTRMCLRLLHLQPGGTLGDRLTPYR